jgi:LmbE family N-acetylglucosaminyl deacetylase
MTFNFESRLMLIAPHPDDEALACSIALQRAVAAGAKIRVVYATDGDDNPWPQRVLARKWHIDAADRKRWGKLRRSEALSALRVLGVEGRATEFLALPDQGLTNLLRTDCRPAVDRFAQIIRTWSPTHLLVPSILDTHPDHSALAVILRLALAEITAPVPIFSYAVHGKSVAFSAQAEPLIQ